MSIKHTPGLKMRRHDFQVGWFHEIAERHGKESIELMQAQQLFDERGQLYFAFIKQPKEKAA